MCAPTSLPFSRTQTEISRPASAGELLQPDRGGQAGGARADDHDIILHRFAFAHSLLSSRSRADGVRRDHSTHLPCQFLDRAVNGGEDGSVGGDSERNRAAPRRAARLPGGWRPASMSPSRKAARLAEARARRAVPRRRTGAEPNRRPAQPGNPRRASAMAGEQRPAAAGRRPREAGPAARARERGGHAAQRRARRSRMRRPGSRSAARPGR